MKLSPPHRQPNRLARAIMLPLLLSPIAHCLAQDAGRGIGEGGPAEQQGQRLDRVIIRGEASDTDLRRRASVAKQIYGREEIDKFGDTNVADVLKRLPGVTMQGSAPRMRGLGSDYTTILINGDRAPPGFSLDQVSPEQVERIEVSKAPTADQSAQAIAGSINIVLRDAPRVSQRDLRLNAGLAPHRPRLGGSFTLGEKAGDFSLALPVSGFEWRRPTDIENTREMTGLDGQFSKIIQKGVQEIHGYGFNLGPRLSWKISDDQSLTWQSFIQKGWWRNSTSFSNEVVAGNPSIEDNNRNRGTWENLRSNLQWTNYLSSSQSIEIKAGVQASRGTFDTQTFRLDAVQLQAIGDNFEKGFTQAGKYTQTLDGSHTLAAGWDLEYRNREEKRTVTNFGQAQLPDYEGQPYSAKIDRQALFVQDEWQINKAWSTNIGVRAERIATTSKTIDLPVDNQSSVVTPVFHLNYKFDPAARDQIRGSITRSYKPPGLPTLVARPSVNRLFSDLTHTNTELAPDRTGNAKLLPELATGLDLAYEKYLADGGLLSIGVFHRQIDQLVRNVTSLKTVSWASAPRWVSEPVNFANAQTSGVELEAKGRGGELLPMLFERRTPLNLRGALSFYWSKVDMVPGPNNRLDAQQPWSGSFGADYRVPGVPVTTGVNLTVTPGYTTQQTASQALQQARARGLDVYARWNYSPKVAFRISGNQLFPLDSQSRTLLSNGYSSTAWRSGYASFGVGAEIKL